MEFYEKFEKNYHINMKEKNCFLYIHIKRMDNNRLAKNISRIKEKKNHVPNKLTKNRAGISELEIKERDWFRKRVIAVHD